MELIQIVCVLSLFPAVLACAYYVVLAGTRLLAGPVARLPSSKPTHSFAIVIPAHNEEAVLAGTLQSCADLDYPRSKVQVHVIADNCSDRTAAVARDLGVECWERT